MSNSSSSKEIKDSNEKLQVIINHIQDIIIESELNGIFTYVSPQAYDILGYKPEEVIGLNGFKFIHPEDLPKLTSKFTNLIKSGGPVQVEYRALHKDGHYVYLSAKGTIVKQNGNIKLIAVLRDITKERETEQKYELLANNINDIIWTNDLNTNTTYVSPSVKKILGYTVEEDIARPMTEKFTPESLKKIGKLIKNHITPKNIKDRNYNPVLRLELEQYHKNGSIIPCEITVNLMRDEKGIAFGLVGITRNIARRKVAEQRLKESEQKYRLIAINSQDIVYTLDMNLNNTFISPSVFNVLGYSVDEAFSMSPRDNTPKDDLEKISLVYKEEFKLERKKVIIKNLNRKRVYTIREKHKDGRVLTMEHTISWIRDENGIAVGILGIARDVTETKNTENLLKESEEKYRTLFENSPNAVGLINTKGIVIQGNSNIEKIFGYKKEEFVGQNFRRFPLFSEENNAIVLNNLIKLIKGEIPEPQELKLHRKDGSVIWVSMIASIVRLKKETLFQIITQDISKIKNAEKILKEQNKELQEVSNLKTEFLSRASHELKTPLATINGYAELIKLKDEKLKQDQLKMIEGIQKGSARLEGIIHKLIESSKLETSKIELHTKEEDLSLLIKLCVNEVQSLAKTREIDINLGIANLILTKLNKDQIHEVISNLLSNAIKYSPHNTIINIKSEVNGTSIIISIKDSGIGFTENEKITIFNKFGKIARESNGIDVFSEGSGLGLYISKKIVELHDGKMWFESEGRNKGSTFYFSLPII